MTKIGAQLARIQRGRAEITRQLESMKAEEEQRAIARGQHAVVSENASATQITAAFRRRSKNAHPDNGGNVGADVVGVALSAFGLPLGFLNVPMEVVLEAELRLSWAMLAPHLIGRNEKSPHLLPG